MHRIRSCGRALLCLNLLFGSLNSQGSSHLCSKNLTRLSSQIGVVSNDLAQKIEVRQPSQGEIDTFIQRYRESPREPSFDSFVFDEPIVGQSFVVGGEEYQVLQHYGLTAYQAQKKSGEKFQLKLSRPKVKSEVYDYWASQFYREQGFNVLEIYDLPQRTVVSGKEVSVTLKPDISGLTIYELRRFLQDDLSTKEFYEQRLLEQMEKLQQLHSSRAFEAWLKLRGVDVSEETFGLWFYEIPKGDIKDIDFLFTADGWVLIDP